MPTKDTKKKGGGVHVKYMDGFPSDYEFMTCLVKQVSLDAATPLIVTVPLAL